MELLSSQSLILIFGALLGSFVSGVAGMGGGMLLLMIMSMALPFQVLIPAHGLVQIGSNVSRTALHYKSIDGKIALKYLAGALIGAAIGWNIQLDVSDQIIGFLLGGFILVSAWFPFWRLGHLKHLGNYVLIGTVSTILSLFVGVAGPLIHPFVINEKHLDRFGFIGTESFCAGVTHILKVVIFVMWGVSLWEYGWVLGGMIAVTFVGAYLGKLVVKRFHEHRFRIFVKILISLLALRLIVKASGFVI